MSYSGTLQSIRAMSLDERIQLVQTIWDDLAAEQTQVTDLTEAQEQEVARRLAAHEAAPENVISWEQVKAQAEARLQK